MAWKYKMANSNEGVLTDEEYSKLKDDIVFLGTNKTTRFTDLGRDKIAKEPNETPKPVPAPEVKPPVMDKKG